MKVGSLFAGVGGFDIAAERAGMKVAWQSEVDPHASRVLEHHWPGLNKGDVNEIRSAPAVDVLCGGFPCQSYSVAGSRGGLADDRGALWWQYLRLIRELNPRWVVAENVPGLLSSNRGRDFTTIVQSLVQCGYGIVWGVLDAQYFGVAQRRRRLFIVGHPGGQPRPEILALSEGLCGNPPPSRPSDTGRAQDSPRVGSDGLLADSGVVRTLKARYGMSGSHAEGGHLVATGWPEAQGESWREADPMGTLGTGTASTRHLAHIVSQPLAFAQNQRDEVRMVDVPGALSAQPGMKQQTYVANPRVRRLTPLECERLQGFPDGWTDIEGNSDTQRYRQLGNAVAVPVAEWIMRRIASIEEGT